MVDWNAPDAKDRLIDALLAAQLMSGGGFPSCTIVSQLYGRDATYNSIENKLRPYKRRAQVMIAVARDAARRNSRPEGTNASSNSPARPPTAVVPAPSSSGSKKRKTEAIIKKEKEDTASLEDIPEEEDGHKNADDDDLGGGMGGDEAGSISL